MYLASNLKRIIALAIVFTFAFGLVIVSGTDAAQATTAQSSVRPAYSFPSGVLGLKEAPRPSTVDASGTLAAAARSTIGWPSWDDIKSFGNEVACNNAVGAVVSLASDVCDDTLVGSAVSAAQEAIDCATDIPLCITNWIYNVVGSGVAWVATGIVTLVTSTREECLTGGNGGSGDFKPGGALVRNCEERIKADYFPEGYIQEQDLYDVIAMSYASQKSNIQDQLAEIRKYGVTPAERPTFNALKQQLENIENRTDDSALSEEATVGQLRSQNLIFSVPKSAVSTPTWDREYGKYVLIALMLLVPMIMAAAIQSLISGKGHLMLRAVVISMPAAILGMVIAPWLTRSLMVLTDSFSAWIIADVQGDVEGYFQNMSPQSQATMGIPLLLGFSLVALVFIFAALLIWFVLSMREASVALIAVFLPIAFAGSVWPALAKWTLRAIKLLVAAIISKIFIVGAISLGLGTFTGATETGNVSISHMIFGATIFFIAAFSPHLVMKFFDEIGDAINAAGGTGAIGRGLNAAANANGTRNIVGQQGLAGIIKGKMGLGGDSGGGPSGGGPDGGLSQLAAGMASLKPGATPASTAAAADRTAEKQGFGAAGRAHAASMGAEEGPGATGLDKMQAANDAAIRATAGTTGSAQGDAIAAGQAVTQAAMDNGVSQPEAVAMGQSAASQALGGGPLPANVSGAVAAHGAGITKAAAKVKRSQNRWYAAGSVAKGAVNPVWGVVNQVKKPNHLK